MGYGYYSDLYDIERSIDHLVSVINVMWFVVCILAIIAFFVSIFAIRKFVSIWREKGYTDTSLGLWMIGIFLPFGIIVVALYVIAAPNKKIEGADHTPAPSELPPL